MKPKIIYAFDGYCGWCWGLDAVMTRLATEFSDRFDFRAVCGGLIVGARIGPLGKFGEYIEGAIPRVSELSGAKFSEAYLTLIRNRDTVQDSRVPAAAFALILEKFPKVNSIDLAHKILTMNFEQGLDLSEAKIYSALLSHYDVPIGDFDLSKNPEPHYARAERQFELARDFGAEAFPTIIYGSGDEYFPLVQGYQGYDALSHAFDTLHRDPPAL